MKICSCYCYTRRNWEKLPYCDLLYINQLKAYTAKYNVLQHRKDILCYFVLSVCFMLFQASATDEAIALLLFEWAVSKYRVGKFRALAVAKILQRRQAEILEEVRHTVMCDLIHLFC